MATPATVASSDDEGALTWASRAACRGVGVDDDGARRRFNRVFTTGQRGMRVHEVDHGFFQRIGEDV